LAALAAALLTISPAQAQSQPMPDLVPGVIRLEPQAGSCWSSASPLGLRVTVTNSGTGAAGAFSVDVNGARQRVSSLAAGQSTALWFQGYNQGVNVIQLDVLSELQNESNKGNNVAQPIGSSFSPTTQCTATPSPTPTQTSTATPVGFQSPTPTATGSASATPAATFTFTPTGIPAT